MTLSCGSPLQRNLCFSSAFIAKSATCFLVCRLSGGSDIHSRIMVRRASCSGLIFQAPFSVRHDLRYIGSHHGAQTSLGGALLVLIP